MAHEHYGEPCNGARLNQCERLEQFVEGPEPARQHHKALAVLHKAGLTGKEIAEVDAKVHVLIDTLFKGQLNAESHGDATGVVRSFVGGFHDSGTTARDHGVACLYQAATNL